MKPEINKKTLGILGVALAALTSVYAIKNRKEIKNKTEAAKEKSALALHKRIGTPIYNYLRRKNDIPF